MTDNRRKEIARSLGAAIAVTCRKKGISIRKAAGQSGISAATLSRINHESELPRMDVFIKLVEWTGLDADLLLCIRQHGHPKPPALVDTQDILESHERS